MCESCDLTSASSIRARCHYSLTNVEVNSQKDDRMISWMIVKTDGLPYLTMVNAIVTVVHNDGSHENSTQ